LVLQDVVIFSGDIKYNILLSRDIPFERMEKYSKYVNADKFIEKLPEGMILYLTKGEQTFQPDRDS